MLVPLTAIAIPSLPLAAAMVLCSSDRKQVHASKKSQKSIRGKSTKSASKSGKSKSRSKHASKSAKSGSKKQVSKREKSSRASKSAKSSKSEKSKRSSNNKSSKSGSRKSKNSKRSSSKKSSRPEKKDAKNKKECSKGSSKSSKSSSAARIRKEANEAAAAHAAALQNSKKQQEQASANAPPHHGGWDAAPDGHVDKSRIPAPQQNCSEKLKSDKQQATPKKVSIEDEVKTIRHTQDVQVKPDRLLYQPIGGVSCINITNNSQDRKAYKIKCSDNALYRVNPVYGFAEPGETIKVDVLRNNGEKKMDKLCVLTAKATGENNPREIFTREDLQREMMVIPLIV
ncbi:unnamed protein product [Caenorhabditis bovis]|uniref:Major sperm protein n=1 Tax=Caenorhabditis bovis TaxID=2654633 RepID=A0A8S1F758_9PELO|nr:unnamed protein product [Caenorhabditis bovis]